MGYAGQPMKVIKANRALLKKGNTFKKVKKMFLDTSNSKTELEFKQVSAVKLAHIKTEIRRKAKRNAQKEIAITIICILLVLLLFYWFLFG